MQHAELPTFAFLNAALVLLAFLLNGHLRAHNTIATATLISSLFVLNIVYGVDAVVWAGSVADNVQVWCNISSNVIVGYFIAIPAACLCISMHLEQVFSGRNVATNSPLRQKIVEVFLCMVLPPIYMVLHYVVQGPNYVIIEDIGCRPSVFQSIPAIFFFWIPPYLLAVITIFYAGIALRHLIQRSRPQPTCASTSITPEPQVTSHETRLLFASLSTTLFLPIITTSLDLSLTGSTILHWSWSAAHSAPVTSSAAETPASTRMTMFASVWMVFLASIAMVGLLLSSEDALNRGRAWITVMHGWFTFGSGSGSSFVDVELGSRTARHPQSLDKSRRVSVKPPVLANLDLINRDDIVSVVSDSSTLCSSNSGPSTKSHHKSKREDRRKALAPIKTQDTRPEVRPPVLASLDCVDYSPSVNDTTRDSTISAEEPIKPVVLISDSDESFASATMDYLMSPIGREAIQQDEAQKQRVVGDSPTKKVVSDRTQAFAMVWPQPPADVPIPGPVRPSIDRRATTTPASPPQPTVRALTPRPKAHMKGRTETERRKTSHNSFLPL